MWIVALIISILWIVLLVLDTVQSFFLLTFFVVLTAVMAFFTWCIVGYNFILRKRTYMIVKRVSELDRKDSKYQNLFIIFDFITGEENNLTVVKNAMQQVYFFPKRITKNPVKVKKRVLLGYLIEYYITLCHEPLDTNFFWDYNKNFFTWKFIGVTTFIGTVGILTLYFCHVYVPNPNAIIYTSLYFVFGAFLLPLLAKIFGNII